ncbi:VOC family protein [Clostridium sp. D2Q-14]|uniref:VOC family protein n=1 Tax=Anaeromonas gelatinilytica TaxID=2683194 RepID=UPI00193C1AE8|nr:VOC family protein [Anaeromonas gelatinilytica]MBS4536551.1 VOC family protein [Anaeromonas gelatinilytica]
MKFCWTTIRVKDLEESLKFYEEIVGLTVNRRFQTAEGMKIAFLGIGETQLELIYDENKEEGIIGKDISLGFEIDSVERKMKFVKENGIEIYSGLFQPNPNIKFFYVQDPNGLKIQFIESIK